jgi:HEAT repeat protein
VIIAKRSGAMGLVVMLAVGASGAALAQGSRFERLAPIELVDAWEGASRQEQPEIVERLLDDRDAALPALRTAAVTGSTRARRFAVRMLGEMRDSAGVPALLAATAHPDVSVRKGAVYGLRAIGDRGAAPRIRALVQTATDRGLLKGAIAALGALGDAGDAPRLRPLAMHPDASVRVMAAAALAMLGSAEGEDVLLAALDGGDPLAEKNATLALGYLDTAAARGRLQAILDDPDGRWKSYAVMALAQQNLRAESAPQQAQRLGALAGGRDRLVAAWALERLVDLGTPEAVAELAKTANRGGRLGAMAQRRLAIAEAP